MVILVFSLSVYSTSPCFLSLSSLFTDSNTWCKTSKIITSVIPVFSSNSSSSWWPKAFPGLSDNLLMTIVMPSSCLLHSSPLPSPPYPENTTTVLVLVNVHYTFLGRFFAYSTYIICTFLGTFHFPKISTYSLLLLLVLCLCLCLCSNFWPGALTALLTYLYVCLSVCSYVCYKTKTPQDQKIARPLMIYCLCLLLSSPTSNSIIK